MKASPHCPLQVSHVGIDRDVICHRLRLPDTASFEARLRERCGAGARTIIGGVEMLTPLQGSNLKLQAYELLLKNYPVWRRSVTMVQVCFADAARFDESASQSMENRATVHRIRERFGAEAIHYLEVGHEIAVDEWSVNFRLALFRLFDVLLNCATKDGLNLLPFEFVLTKNVQNASGIVVLSEFVGCSHVLNGGVRVNPFYLEQACPLLAAPSLHLLTRTWSTAASFYASAPLELLDLSDRWLSNSTQRSRCRMTSALRALPRTIGSSPKIRPHLGCT